MTPAEFLEMILSLSLQTALIVLATCAATWMVSADAIRSRLWAACHVLIIAATLRGFLFPRLRMIHPWSAISPAAAVELALFEHRTGQVLLVVWAAGTCISTLLLLRSCWKIRRFLKTCRPVDSESLPQLDVGSPGRKSAAILSSSVLRSPFCWQIHEPVVVIPEFLLKFEPEEQKLIMRHELQHLRTGHPLLLFLQRIVELVFWFHPLVWWSSRRAELTREFACDEQTVHSRTEVAGYLRCMLKIVEQSGTEDSSRAFDLTFGRRRGEIAQRAARLTVKARRAFWTTKLATNAGAVPLILLVVFSLAVSFIWIPADVLKSSRSHWSAWPTWTASALNAAGLPVRDYDVYDTRSQLYELMEDAAADR